MTKNQQKQGTLETDPQEILILIVMTLTVINMFKELIDKIDNLSEKNQTFKNGNSKTVLKTQSMILYQIRHS